MLQLDSVQSASSPPTADASCAQPESPPDGGLRAWMAVAGGHLVFMNTWGVVNSFGVFQTHYTSSLAQPPSAVSWIGSLQVFLLFSVGALTGRLTDLGYFRPIFLLGSILIVCGHLTASWATKYWQVLIAQGICVGIGNGCLFNPGLSVLTTYFSKKMGVAVAIASAGSASGGLIYPSMVRQLLPQVGLPWTMRALALLQLVTVGATNFLVQSRIRPPPTTQWFDWDVFRRLDRVLFAAGGFTNFWGMYVVFYFLASFSKDVLSMPYTDSLNLLLVLNGVGAIGRVVSGYIGDRFGVLNIYILTTVSTGGMIFCWMSVHSTTGLYIWTCAFAITAGGSQALFPACMGGLSSDARKRGTMIGMISGVVSFALLTGSPIGGALVEMAGGSYYGAQAFAGSSVILSSGFLFFSKMLRAKSEMSISRNA